MAETRSDPAWRALLAKQRAAAFTRRAIATRRAQGLQTSALEQRLARLLHEIEILQIEAGTR
jgi:hypothetical protein